MALVYDVTSSSVKNQNPLEDLLKRTRKHNTNMGKDEFLKLLITQLQYQDPLKPTEDKEFIAQMAQFTALEQMSNLNKNYSVSQSISLMGHTINFVDPKLSEETEITGIVRSVKLVEGNPKIIVECGRDKENKPILIETEFANVKQVV